MKPPLTPEQIENWRRVLFGQIGAYALIMPVAEIEAHRGRMQEWAECASDAVTGAGDK